MAFLVVRPLSRYKVIIGRPGISTMGAVVSTAHAMMTFPTKAGICTIKLSLDSFSVAGIEEERQIRTEVTINNDYLDQTIQIGPSLTVK
jgi:hypothetical protein